MKRTFYDIDVSGACRCLRLYACIRGDVDLVLGLMMREWIIIVLGIPGCLWYTGLSSSSGLLAALLGRW
jgi:hypothetical protein